MQRHYKFIGLALAAWLMSISAGQAAAPAVSNVTVTRLAHTKLFNITYDVSSDVSPLAVSLLITTNDIYGTNYDFTRYVLPGTTATNLITNFTGTGYGANVTSGTSKTIAWDAGAVLGDSLKPTPARFHVAASDKISPTGFALIPAGFFIRGDTNVSAQPVYSVYVSDFYMEVTEVTASLWSNVYQWATNNGYSFTNAGSGKGTNYPIQTLDWYDCVKWCNARTEKEFGINSLACCYYTNTSFTANNIYRTGETNISTNCVNWSTNGYRLATEAEWEKAAQGGAGSSVSNRFPWGQDAGTITHSRANYQSRTNEWYDVSPTRGLHPAYGNTTAPAGSFSANGYGVYDMAGNIFELCWDYLATFSTAYGASETNNPHGTVTTVNHACRGGDFHYQSSFCVHAQRYAAGPTNTYNWLGFRCVHIP